MTKTTIRGLACASFAACLWLTPVAAQDAAGGATHTDDAAAITAASRAFSKAYVEGDTAALRDIYLPDAVLLPPGRQVRGIDAIVRYFAPGPRRTNVTHAMTSSDLQIDGNTAVDVGTWSNGWRVEEGPLQEASEWYLVVWKKSVDGRWRIAWDMWHRPNG